MNLNVGACIYCGERAGSLSREHVMPRGLGGNWAPEGMADALVLQDASCETCRETTRKIEEECLVGMMDPARAKLALKRKDRANPTTTALVDLIDGSKEKRELTWDHVPGPVVLPSFYAAGCFAGRPFEAPAPCDYQFIVVAPTTVPMAPNMTRIGIALSANSRAFAQMLAKIGLGVAVAGLGLGGFTPLVRDVILKAGAGHGHWVGGYAGTDRVEPQSELFHSVKLSPRAGPDGNFVLVEIRLFAEFGGPTNYVVVGSRIDASA